MIGESLNVTLNDAYTTVANKEEYCQVTYDLSLLDQPSD